MTTLKQALNEGRFVCVLEVVPQQSAPRLAALGQIAQRGHLAGWQLLPAFADRVGLHSDLSPLEGACAFHAIRPLIPPASGHLFHAYPAGQSERSDAGLHC